MKKMYIIVALATCLCMAFSAVIMNNGNKTEEIDAAGKIKLGVISGPEAELTEYIASVAKEKYGLTIERVHYDFDSVKNDLSN